MIKFLLYSLLASSDSFNSFGFNAINYAILGEYFFKFIGLLSALIGGKWNAGFSLGYINYIGLIDFCIDFCINELLGDSFSIIF